MTSAAGAMMGGAWGAMSDDTSVLGGMAMGALGGAGLGQGFRAATLYSRMAGRGISRSAAASGAIRQTARETRSFIGTTARQAPNAIKSTLKAGRGWLGM